MRSSRCWSVQTSSRCTREWRPGTEPILDAQAIELIKPGAIVVNTSRAGLVDGNALVRAVETGRLSGVAIDVAGSEYREGRLPADPIVEAARHDPRFLVTPHIGGATLDAHGMVFSQLARLVALRLRPTVANEATPVRPPRPTATHPI